MTPPSFVLSESHHQWPLPGSSVYLGYVKETTREEIEEQEGQGERVGEWEIGSENGYVMLLPASARSLTILLI